LFGGCEKAKNILKTSAKNQKSNSIEKLSKSGVVNFANSQGPQKRQLPKEKILEDYD